MSREKDISEYVIELRPYAMFLCNFDKNKADDLVQNTCEVVLRRFGKYIDKPLVEQKRLLNLTLKNVFIDSVRKTNKEPKMNNIEFYYNLDNGDEDNENINMVLGRRMIEYVANSTDTTLNTFYLWLNGYKYKEIADIKGMSINTVLGHKKHAIKKLLYKFGHLKK
jgi:DNA-directed RNA polymerase specialized sigma24 family protein